MNEQQLEATLNRIHDWIKSADQKNSVFLALVIGISAVGGEKVIPFLFERISTENMLTILVFVTGIVMYAWSIYKSLAILRPSLTNKAESVTYFGSISKMKLDEYQSLVEKYNKKKYTKELAEQIYIGSQIANKKHRQLSEAIGIFIFSVIITIVFIGLSYVV